MMYYDEDIRKAASIIEKRWKATQYKKQFNELKCAVCAAEYSLTQDIVCKLNPAERQLLDDPSLQAKIKIRFGGGTFPPVVLFKVYMSMSGRKDHGVVGSMGLERKEGVITLQERGGMSILSGKGGGMKYISGQKMIQPDSAAAEDALRQMGERKYYKQVIEDDCRRHILKVTDEVDVISTRDYMLYMSNTDESPACLGGKDNSWRMLDLSPWLRQGKSCYLNLHKWTSSKLARHPQSNDNKSGGIMDRRGRKKGKDGGREDGERKRNSRLARSRIEQMRTLYSKGKMDESGKMAEEGDIDEWKGHQWQQGKEEEDLEDEAYQVIQWSQGLNIDDI